jgi:hypothetical protein
MLFVGWVYRKKTGVPYPGKAGTHYLRKTGASYPGEMGHGWTASGRGGCPVPETCMCTGIVTGKGGFTVPGKGECTVLYLGFAAHRKRGCTYHYERGVLYFGRSGGGGGGRYRTWDKGCTVPVRCVSIVPGKDGHT